MPSFGPASLEQLMTCRDELKVVGYEVVKHFDCSVLEGARPDEDQYEYFRLGKSHLDGVINRSKHQVTDEDPLSRAMDLMPYPAVMHGVNIWSQAGRTRFHLFAGFVLAVGISNGIDLIWGGDWNGDFNSDDTGFFDGPHFELARPDDVKVMAKLNEDKEYKGCP